MKINENTQIGDNEITLKDLLKSREFIFVNLNQRQYIASTNNTKVNFNNVLVNNADSDHLQFTNNGIKIGSGVKKVRVDLSLWMEAASGYSELHIVQNSSNKTTVIFPYTSEDLWKTVSSFAFLEVSEGDMIYAHARFSQANANNNVAGLYGYSCNMSVQIIE